jgi:site-specific recombinase XerD
VWAASTDCALVLFASRDAGAPARAIQELAGHQDLLTTQRYMHLSPAALDSAIRLLDSS